jgi:tRNA 5-methylaminomethyl-2-thiouridine biosynthesis bifunctional protein
VTASDPAPDRGVALLGRRPATLLWRDEVPWSDQFEDGYFSAAGGARESHHVFLAGNALPARWIGCPRFTIVETGFGTGLNLLTTWRAWQEQGAPCPLHFISIEAYPLSPNDLRSALASWPEFDRLSAALLDQYPAPLPGLHRLHLAEGRLTLDLLLLPLAEALQALQRMPDLGVDAWYLDGFAPARNPEMWTAELFQSMAELSNPAASFATFTAASAVRRGLQDAGFTVEKTPGYGRKRHMLRGNLAAPPAPARQEDTPWQLPAHRYPGAAAGDLRGCPETGEIAIIGAGLAGATTAEALARRGYPVTLYEQGDVASAASGNSQGALYTRLSHQASDLSLFSLHSFCYATRYYRKLLAAGLLDDGELCGLLQLRDPLSESDPLRATLASLPGLARMLSASEAREVSGISDSGPGLYFPDSGWMNPAAVCRAALTDPGIALRTGLGPLSLARDGEHWIIRDEHGQTAGSASVVIVACGIHSARLAGADWLALQAVRGQTTEVASRQALAQVRTVVCHEGYLPPARAGRHCIGATFDLRDPGSDLRPADHQRNIDQLASALPSLAPALPAAADAAALPGHASHRCASRDYLPVVGPVPDAGHFSEDFADLRRNARQSIPRAGSYLPGLYINTCHGSRGLTSTPLAAELLAAQICAEPWPLPAALAQSLAPGRFLIRDLVRGRR